jgi:hypothetical protein
MLTYPAHTYLLCLGKKARICEMFSLKPMARRVSASSRTRTSRDRKSNTSHLGYGRRGREKKRGEEIEQSRGE